MSALLCLSMMLAACSTPVDESDETDTGTDDTGTEDVTEIETEKEVPVDEVVDYSAILGEWTKYLTSVGIEEEIAYDSATYMFKESNSDTVNYSSYTFGSLARVTKVTKAVYDDGKLVSPRVDSAIFYNLKTGEKVLSVTDSGYNSDLGIHTTEYQADIYCGAIIEVIKSVWTNLGDEENPDWQYVTTYSYYDNAGKELAKDLEDRAVYITAGGAHCVTIADKAYHCKDGEIILVTHANDTYAIPDLDDAEYKGYKYSFYNMYGEQNIQVLNESYELVVDYAVPSYLDSYQRRFILENGDVYIYSVEERDDNDEDYDFIDGDRKYKVWHIILSVTTGEATFVDAPFILAQFVFTNSDTESSGIKLNGEYQYAEIVRIEDGELANDVEFVILDNTLTEKATLPAILKNQTGLEKGLGDGRFKIEAEGIYGDPAAYIADATTGEISRYITSNYTAKVDGGFIAKDKLYNDDLEMIFDLEDVENYWVYSGAVLYTVTETVDASELEGENESETETDGDETVDVIVAYVAYIDKNGELETKKIGTDADVEYIGYQLYTVQTDSGMYVRNRLGKSLALNSADTIVSISVVASCDESVVIRATHHKPTSSGGYEVELRYYIIK